MDARAVPLQLSLRKRDGLFRERPAIYVLILLAAYAASFLYKFRVDNIFACPASGYTSDKYLSNCDTSYGDYEHGAFWFDLESAAEMSAARADRKVICGPNRNGFYYVLDRITGQFLAGTPFVEVNWAQGLTSVGRPIPADRGTVTEGSRVTKPGINGGVNWEPVCLQGRVQLARHTED